MNIDEIDSVETLKAMAFDEIQKVQVAQNNLQLLNQRINQIQEMGMLEQSQVAEKAHTK